MKLCLAYLIILISTLTSCRYLGKKELSYEAIVEIDELKANKINDFWTEDEVVLCYVINSYRSSGTLYATSTGVWQEVFTQGEIKKLKKTITVPLVEDGHVTISMGLVEVDTPEEDYSLPDFDGKIFANKNVFTITGKRKFIKKLDKPVFSDWNLISETFEHCGYKNFLQRHLHLSKVRINDDLGCFIINIKNDRLVPGDEIPKEFSFRGKDVLQYISGSDNNNVDYSIKLLLRQR